MIENYSQHASNERTFLAWVRTAIALVGFGLAAARIGNIQSPLWSEVALLTSGGIVVLVAFVRMRWLRHRIDAARALDDSKLPAETLLMLLIAALFALLATFVIHVHQG